MAKFGLPAISSSLPADVRQFLERVREAITTLGDSSVTTSDLTGTGLFGMSGGTLVGNWPEGGYIDMSPPPAPKNFAARGAMAHIFLTWDHATSNNIAHMEIWRADYNPDPAYNAFGKKQMVGTSMGDLFSDPVAPGTAYVYWGRYISKAGVEGPWSSQAGTYARTADDPEYLLAQLTGKITKGQLYTSLLEPIAKIPGQEVAVQVQSQKIGDLGAEYTVKIDVAGHISGYGLASMKSTDSGYVESEFGVLANRFWVSPPVASSGTSFPTSGLYDGFVFYHTGEKKPYYYRKARPATYGANGVVVNPAVTEGWSNVSPNLPFVVSATPTTIVDGAGKSTEIPAGVYMDAAYIRDASIKTAQIFDLSADKITAGDISADRLSANTIKAVNLSSTGTINANKINGQGLMIYDSNGTPIFTSGSYLMDYGRITDGPPANSTVNRITTGGEPANPVDGDIWVDTSTTPDTIKTRVAGKWLSAATNTTDKIWTGNQPTSGMVKGDLWVSTETADFPSSLYQYDGTAWKIMATVGAAFGSGTLAGNVVGQINKDNVETYIAGAAITNAYIGNVIQSSAKSNPYNKGVSGWQINKEGNCEFNNIVARGMVSSGGVYDSWVDCIKNTNVSTGFHLSTDGLALGSLGSGSYFSVSRSGNMFLPGLNVVNGKMTLSALNVVDTLQIKGNAVILPTGKTVVDSITTSVSHTFTISGLAPGEYVPVAMSLSFSGNGAITLTATLNGNQYNYYTVGGGDYSYLTDMVGLPNGTHTIVFSAPSGVGAGLRRFGIYIQVYKR